ncbi:MAG: glycosyltransferase family 4 protein [Planctomycetota bacterium]|nr:glycosyltransferase family 4 protein [Planctomycetota bacterium]
MKILHVITTLDVGGAEMHLLSQVKGQSERGHEVQVAYLKGHGTLVHDFEASGAKRVFSLGSTLRSPLALSRVMGDVDLVHTHLLKADMLGALVARVTFRSKKLVASKHNDEQVLKRPLVSLVHGVLGSAPRRTIVLSDHVGRFIEQYGRVGKRRIERIYYGIDSAPFEAAARASAASREAVRVSFGFDSKDVVFTCVARFAPQKAHDVLLKALSKARSQAGGAHVKLLLVGDDPFGDGRVKAEVLARELDLGPACVFAGIRRDVPALLAASDVFVMCSLWEGLGLVFLESMATGIPVLATRVSAVPEVVVEGETGLLVPPADVDALANGMLRLAGDPALRARLGGNGPRVVREKFGLPRMVDETIAVYREILSR